MRVPILSGVSILSATWQVASLVVTNAATWFVARAKSGREARDARWDAAKAITTAAAGVRGSLCDAADRLRRATRTGSVGVRGYFCDPEPLVAESTIEVLRDAIARCAKFPQATHALWAMACRAVETAARSDARLRDPSAISTLDAIQIDSYQDDVTRAIRAIDLALEATIVIASADTAATIRRLIAWL